MNGGVELSVLRNMLVSRHSRISNTYFILPIMILFFILNKLTNLDQLA